jgi:hypothetical protein
MALGEVIEYSIKVRVVTAQSQAPASCNEFERITSGALQLVLNKPTTPYYVSSVTVESMEQVA